MDSRSREGAWIEMCLRRQLSVLADSRSREGAWIEIALRFWRDFGLMGRSREGAWIEMRFLVNSQASAAVAPARERGLKSFRSYWLIWNEWVAPARERGLKY